MGFDVLVSLAVCEGVPDAMVIGVGFGVPCSLAVSEGVPDAMVAGVGFGVPGSLAVLGGAPDARVAGVGFGVPGSLAVSDAMVAGVGVGAPGLPEDDPAPTGADGVCPPDDVVVTVLREPGPGVTVLCVVAPDRLPVAEPPPMAECVVPAAWESGDLPAWPVPEPVGPAESPVDAVFGDGLAEAGCAALDEAASGVARAALDGVVAAGRPTWVEAADDDSIEAADDGLAGAAGGDGLAGAAGGDGLAGVDGGDGLGELGCAVPVGPACGVAPVADCPSAGPRFGAGGPGFGRLRPGAGRRASGRLRLGVLMSVSHAGPRS
ncbi:hypothetical protein [Actinoplanes sp. CA-252034]|uniref:hypothetical protein n=1 Tax=Actinoplanes sp. CA-252034 TaxID=3239906 RepID=UPI003D99E933